MNYSSALENNVHITLKEWHEYLLEKARKRLHWLNQSSFIQRATLNDSGKGLLQDEKD